MAFMGISSIVELHFARRGVGVGIIPRKVWYIDTHTHTHDGCIGEF